MSRFLILTILFITLTTTVNSFNRVNHSINTNDTINSLLVVYHNLTNAQQKKVDNLIETSVALDLGTNGSNVTNEKLTDKINNFVNGLSQSVKDKIDDVQDTFNDVKEDAQDKFEDVQEGVVKQVNNLKNQTSQVIGKVHTTISNASDTVQNEFKKLKNKIEGKSENETTTNVPTIPVNQNLDPYPLTN